MDAIPSRTGTLFRVKTDQHVRASPIAIDAGFVVVNAP
jgi:hypothetical protein